MGLLFVLLCIAVYHYGCKWDKANKKKFEEEQKKREEWRQSVDYHDYSK